MVNVSICVYFLTFNRYSTTLNYDNNKIYNAIFPHPLPTGKEHETQKLST